MELSKIERGEVFLVDLNPIIGAEIGKARPAVVISNNLNNIHADTVTVIPITSAIGKIYPFEVFIKKKEGGIEKDSKAKTNQIRTIDKRRLIKKLGPLKKETIKEIEKAILIHLGI